MSVKMIVIRRLAYDLLRDYSCEIYLIVIGTGRNVDLYNRIMIYYSWSQ